MPFSYPQFMHALQDGNYPLQQPWFDPPTLAPLRKPVAESTLGLFGSCGARLWDQPVLEETNDLSYRLIPREVPATSAQLVMDHKTPVRRWALEDLNVA